MNSILCRDSNKIEHIIFMFPGEILAFNKGGNLVKLKGKKLLEAQKVILYCGKSLPLKGLEMIDDFSIPVGRMCVNCKNELLIHVREILKNDSRS